MIQKKKATFLPLSAIAASLFVAGCASNAAQYPDSYTQRHAIELRDSRQTLNVYPRWAYGVDDRQLADIRAFAKRFHSTTKSIMLVEVPVDPSMKSKEPEDPTVRASLASIHRTLASAGVDRHNVVVRTYPAATSETPLILSFVAMDAQVASNCGQWSDDLAGGATLDGWQNQPHWNLGCASQKNLAAQIADPLDLVRPRVETPRDTATVVRRIHAARAGNDPSTIYSEPTSTQSEQ